MQQKVPKTLDEIILAKIKCHPVYAKRYFFLQDCVSPTRNHYFQAEARPVGAIEIHWEASRAAL